MIAAGLFLCRPHPYLEGESGFAPPFESTMTEHCGICATDASAKNAETAAILSVIPPEDRVALLRVTSMRPLRDGDMSDNGIMQEPITRDAEVMHGTPVFRGTRVPVKTLFEYLEHGDSLDDFLQGFPTVSRELAVQVLEESKELRLARV